MELEPMERSGNSGPRLPLLVLAGIALFLLLGMGVLVKLNERSLPTVKLVGEIERLGQEINLGIEAADVGRGLRSISLALRQGDQQTLLLEREFPSQGFFQAGPAAFHETVALAGRDLKLREGTADLIVTVRDYSWWNWLAGNTVRESRPVVIDIRPPALAVLEATRYLKPGHAGLVVFKADEPLRQAGVILNGFLHPAFALPAAGEGMHAAYVALPHDAVTISEAMVTAADLAGNQGRTGVSFIFKAAVKISDRINLGDGFLNLKLPEFAAHYPEMSGPPLEQYLYVNRVVREQNNRKIMEICRQSAPERLWDGVFLRMRRSSPKAGFADHRSYFYQGDKIDEQFHLGLDLASTSQAEIEAANRGKVVFADYLGIYGHTVIIDHGQGLFSLYSHLSRITAVPGDLVDKGAILGYSGVSGMAGGDHLHFSMLINGIFVNPKEWWDRAWVADHLTTVR